MLPRPLRRSSRRQPAAPYRLIAALAALVCLVAAAPSAAATSVASVEGESTTFDGWNMKQVDDGSAAGGSAVRFGWVGSARMTVRLGRDTDAVTLRVRGDQCAGAPEYRLSVNGAVVTIGPVASTAWTEQTHALPLLAGTHVVEVRFTNDFQQGYGASACDRNLYLDTVSFTASDPTPDVTARSATQVTGYVHQSGTQLLDGENRPLRLRGVNFAGYLLWEGWIWGRGMDYVGESAMMRNLSGLVGADAAEQFRAGVRANFITAADFKAVAAYGLNTVRLPFNYRLLEDDAKPGVYKQAGWDVLDRMVRQASGAGVYLVLDMHAAPCSQMKAFVNDYDGGTFMWSSKACQDRMVAMWKAIAARYANEPIIAGYDLLGETIIDDKQLLALYKRATAAIREVDRNHTIIYEGNTMARTFDLFSTPIDANQLLSFHDYSWAFPGEDLTVRMARYDAAARRLNSPMWAGEFGQSTNADVRKYVDTFDKDPLMAGWTQFTWKQSPGFGALQDIQPTAASTRLVDFMNDPTRARPTAAEAQQGMADFIQAVRFENTLPDADFRAVLSCRSGCGQKPAVMAMPAAASSTTVVEPAPAATPVATPAAPAPAATMTPTPAAAATQAPGAAAIPVPATGRPLDTVVRRAALRDALRKGLTVRLTALAAGRVTVTAARSGRVVARGETTVDTMGRQTIRLSFTAAGRKALQGRRRAALTVVAAYAPDGAVATSQQLGIVLAR